MTHIEEHILELYVLEGAAGGHSEWRAVEDHLRECAECRDLVATMTRFYQDTETEFRRHPQTVPAGKKALLVSRQRLVPVAEGFERVDIPPRPGGLRRFQVFVGRHPFASGAGSFVMGVGLFFAASAIWSSNFKDKNPSYTHFNPSENTLEVYNRADERLWHKPTSKAAELEVSEASLRVRLALVGNLGPQSQNMVVTTIPMWDAAANDWTARVRSFRSDGTLAFECDLNQTATYNGRVYDANFYSLGVALVESPGGQSEDILAVLRNHRSPCFLARLNNGGELIGEYWHFGHLNGPFELPRSQNGELEVALCGVNDIFDSTYQTFPVIVVLAPARIRGVTESTVTPGFGASPSRAEVCYIRLPRTDMAVAQGIVEGVAFLRSSADASLTFYVHGEDATGIQTAFDFTFSRDMKVESVRPMSGEELIHAKLLAAGKISSTFDATYMENLKRGVRYWDGKEWKSEVVVLGGNRPIGKNQE